MPSVTTVLSATESEKSKAGLRTWQRNNPGALEEASTRGSAIHLGCENYLRGLPPDVPEQYQEFWNGISTYLDWFDVLHWSERPLRPDWNHLRSDDREVAYVWSTEHRYAGCPDLIGEMVVSELLLTSKLLMLLTCLLSPIVVTELVSVASESTKSVRSKWLHTDTH